MVRQLVVRHRRFSALTGSAVVALSLLLGACGNGEHAIPGAAAWVDDPFSGGYPTYDHEPTGLRIVFGTPDLGPGTSRVSFAMFDYDGLVSFPTLQVVTQFYPRGGSREPEDGESASLRFNRFPEGGR